MLHYLKKKKYNHGKTLFQSRDRNTTLLHANNFQFIVELLQIVIRPKEKKNPITERADLSYLSNSHDHLKAFAEEGLTVEEDFMVYLFACFFCYPCLHQRSSHHGRKS